MPSEPPDAVPDDVTAAYAEQIEPLRGEVLLFCYRMLGSLADAEDATQEAMLRAWRGLPAFERRSTPKWWLYRIAANVCRSEARRRREPADWTGDGVHGRTSREITPTWLEPLPLSALEGIEGSHDPARRHDLLASVELAFLVALQHLPARERGALILRDVLGFSARETAGILETSVPAVNSGLQRARARVAATASGPSQQQTLATLDDAELGALVRRYTTAWERRDVDEILRLLTEDARYSMPPVKAGYVGSAEIRRFLTELALQERWRFLPSRANGQLAFGTYAWDDEAGSYRASALDVVTLRGRQIAAVTAFLLPDRFAVFDLPAELPGPELPGPEAVA